MARKGKKRVTTKRVTTKQLVGALDYVEELIGRIRTVVQLKYDPGPSRSVPPMGWACRAGSVKPRKKKGKRR